MRLIQFLEVPKVGIIVSWVTPNLNYQRGVCTYVHGHELQGFSSSVDEKYLSQRHGIPNHRVSVKELKLSYHHVSHNLNSLKGVM